MKPFSLIVLFMLLLSSTVYAFNSSEVKNLLESGSAKYKLKKYDEALIDYIAASKLGSPIAKERLGYAYRTGRGVAKDVKAADRYLQDAINLYHLSANIGDITAQYRLGRIYAKKGNLQNKVASYKWILLAAKNNNSSAQKALGDFLRHGFYDSKSKNDPNEYIMWYEKSARLGNGHAAYALAKMNKNDFNHVLKWCMPASKKGHERCLAMLGGVLNINKEGHKEEKIKAVHELAEAEVILYQFILANIYNEGKVIPRDRDKSLQWYNKTFETAIFKSEAGDKKAKRFLAYICHQGAGTQENIDDAQVWLKTNGYVKCKNVKSKVKLN